MRAVRILDAALKHETSLPVELHGRLFVVPTYDLPWTDVWLRSELVSVGAVEARVSRAATYQLLALADYDERTGRGALRLGGREYGLARAS